MEIRSGTRIKTASGEDVGAVDRVVIDPGTYEVTHVVVQKGFLLPTDKVLPVGWIARSSGDEAVLQPDAASFDSLPDFLETHFTPLDETDPEASPFWSGDRARPYYLYPPVGMGGFGYPGAYAIPPGHLEVEQNIPPGTVAVSEGAEVVDKDGNSLGSVERLYTDPQSNEATHFVLSSGLLFKERKLIPIHWVTKLEEDRVHLEVGARFLERIPPFEER